MKILDQCHLVYQPIYDFVDRKVIGYEALLRGPLAPEQLVHEAVASGAMPHVDAAIHRMALEHFTGTETLFLNLHPDSLHRPDLFTSSSRLRALDSVREIVLEITEHAKADYKQLGSKIAQFRRAGYKIAIDDFGSKFNKAFILDELHPDYIKLDQSITKNIERCSEFVYLIRKYSQLTGIQVIAEGIESEQEMDKLRAVGIAKGQGFYLGRPALELP